MLCSFTKQVLAQLDSLDASMSLQFFNIFTLANVALAMERCVSTDKYKSLDSSGR